MASFQDDFSYSSGAALTTRNGDYTRYNYGGSSAALMCTGSAVDWDQNSSSGEFTIYKYTGISPGATQYCEAVVSNGGAFNRGSGVCVRVQSSTNCYILMLRDNRLTMGVIASGSYTELDYATGTYTSGPYTLRLEIDADFNLTGYIDSVETLTADDTSDTYATGGVGIGSQGSDDNITIDSLDCGDIEASGDIEGAAAISFSASGTLYGTVADSRGFGFGLVSDGAIVTGHHEDGSPYVVVDLSDDATYIELNAYTTPQGVPTASPTARNGGMVDPPHGLTAGYDDRDTSYGGSVYDDALNIGEDIAAATAVDVTPPSGGYKSVVVASSCTGTPPSPGDNPLERSCILTVYDASFAPDDGATTFCPWMGGPTKQSALLTYADIDTSSCGSFDLASIDAYWSASLVSNCVTDMTVPWLDHLDQHISRICHPLLDMAGTGYGGTTLEYGREIGRRVAESIVMLQSTSRTDALVRAVCRQGINSYGNRVNGHDIGPNGGHGQGRKWLWLAAAKLFGDPAVLDPSAFEADDPTHINEDGQTFIAAGDPVNGGYGNRINGDPLQVGDPAWGINHADVPANDDYDYGVDANGQYAVINIPNWHMAAWGMQKLLRGEARSRWSHDAFWDFVELFHDEMAADADTYQQSTDLWDDSDIGYGILPCEGTAAMSFSASGAATNANGSSGGSATTTQKVRRIMAHKRFTRARR